MKVALCSRKLFVRSVIASLLALGSSYFFVGCAMRKFSKGAQQNPSSSGLASSVFDAEYSPAANENLDALKKWTEERILAAEGAFSQNGLKRHPSPSYWGDEVVYQIQVDRFADGNKQNNNLNIEENQKNNQLGNEVGIQDYRHGGDIQGIINRLDYLKTLGVTSLWVTPILKSNGSYHGYCTTDFTKIDPGFSYAEPEQGRELFRKMVKTAHSKGIKVILDIVVNHVCDSKTQYNNQKTPFQKYFYQKCTQTLAGNNWTGSTKIEGQRELVFGDSFFKPFRNEAFFSRCGHGGESDGDAAVWGDFSDSMLDLNTNNWDFQEVFTNLHKFWIAYADVDGFRADAAKHVTSDFMAYFSTQIRDYANSIGKNNFYIVGEVAGSGDEQAERVGKMQTEPNNPDSARGRIPEFLRKRILTIKDKYLSHPKFKKPGLNALYDFGHSAAAVSTNRGSGAPINIKNWFWQGGELEHNVPGSEFGKLVGLQDTRENWNVLEIHDWPRFNLYSTGEDINNAMRYKVFNALGYLLTAPGVPVLYYGLEQGLNGDCHGGSRMGVSQEAQNALRSVCSSDSFSNHARYRQDMFASGVFRLGSVVPEINQLAGIGKASVKNFENDVYANTNHSLFQHAAKLIDIRKSCNPLRKGNIYYRAVDSASGNQGGGFLAYSRILNGEEVLVLVNSSNNSRPITKLFLDKNLHAQKLGHKWVDLVSGNKYGVVSDGGGALEFENNYSLAASSVAVFYPEGQAKRRPSGGFTCL
jgi:glycosidase